MCGEEGLSCQQGYPDPCDSNSANRQPNGNIGNKCCSNATRVIRGRREKRWYFQRLSPCNDFGIVFVKPVNHWSFSKVRRFCGLAVMHSET